MSRLQILTGDCRDILPTLEAQSVQCCVSSPPYWGLRDYGTAQWEGGYAECDHKTLSERGQRVRIPDLNASTLALSDVCSHCGARRIDSQLGLESTPEEYIAKMVAVFREVWRVLRDDGTLWLNMGDSYASGEVGRHDSVQGREIDGRRVTSKAIRRQQTKLSTGLKPKDLCMMPACLAMALQADGWYLRSEIVWHKPNPMPESVTDRPTKAHEMIYLLAKQERYYYDNEAIREPLSEVSLQQIDYFRKNGARTDQSDKVFDISRNDAGGALNTKGRGSRGSAMSLAGRNKRTVWTIAQTDTYCRLRSDITPEQRLYVLQRIATLDSRE